MKLAKSSREKIESFFKLYKAEEKFCLPEINFYTGSCAHFITKFLHIHGITIGNIILITPELTRINSAGNKFLPDDLIVHEIAHVLQYREIGFFRFLFQYFLEYYKNLKKIGRYTQKSRNAAYYQLSFEIEARETAENFVIWKKMSQ